MSWLNTMEAKVSEILFLNAEARDSDNVLYYDYLKRYAPHLINKPYGEVLLEESAPSWESITRVRRKIQEKRPELRGAVYEARYHRTDDYVEYAREK